MSGEFVLSGTVQIVTNGGVTRVISYGPEAVTGVGRTAHRDEDGVVRIEGPVTALSAMDPDGFVRCTSHLDRSEDPDGTIERCGYPAPWSTYGALHPIMVMPEGENVSDEVYLQHESRRYQWDEATGEHREEYTPGVRS